MALLILPRFLADHVDWSALVFTPWHVVEWLLLRFSSGFFEEALFRGACFYILYRAWGTTRSGLHRAAAAQDLLFGLLHLNDP